MMFGPDVPDIDIDVAAGRRGDTLANGPCQPCH
jgi:hypothetical protein